MSVPVVGKMHRGCWTGSVLGQAKFTTASIFADEVQNTSDDKGPGSVDEPMSDDLLEQRAPFIVLDPALEWVSIQLTPLPIQPTKPW